MKKVSDFFSMKNMVNDKKIIDNSKYILCDDDLEKLQKTLVEMYQDIYNACNKMKIKPIIVGGSLLGKIRHNGFIPWDDDLDLGMCRTDYEKFKKYAPEILGNEYRVMGPGCKLEATTRFVKVFKENSIYQTMTMAPGTPAKIFIDIFPIDYVPDNKILRTMKGLYCNLLIFITSSMEFCSVLDHEQKSIMKKSKKLYFNMILRILIAKLFNYNDLQKWFTKLDIAIQSKRKTDTCNIALGRKHYFGEVLCENVFFPLQKTEFCGITAWMFNDSDAYLKNLYGNYMEIPPEEKREHHYVRKIEFDTSVKI